LASPRQDTTNLRLRLIVDPKKFLDLAQVLAFESPQASKLRSATSRAYYAAYNVSVEALGGMGFRIDRSGNGHGQVQSLLGNSKNEDLKKISSELGSLHTSRIGADYRMDDPRAENPTNVKAHVLHASRIIQTLERCCGGSNRNDIIKAIKDYDQLIKGAGQKG
jgi:hypothetical protein